MPRRPRAVLSKLPVSDALPPWATEAIILGRHVAQSVALADAEKVGPARRSDAANCAMVVAYLISFFCSGNQPYGLRGFNARVRPFSKRIAAALGLARLPSSTAVSAFLDQVTAAQAPPIANALLQCSTVDNVLADHRWTLVFDGAGNGYTIVDTDPTVLALRQRALPVDDDLPEPIRDSDSLAALGYSGRHRGDVIVSACRTQLTGSGLWSGLSVEAGNTKLAPALREALVQTSDQLGEVTSRRLPVIVRIDGAGGNVPCLVELATGSTLFVVRSAHYLILQGEDVLQYLATGPWHPVADSLSGPRREALDLGPWCWHAADKSGRTATPRMVVRRFRSADPKHKHGSGWLHDGWHYELFGCNFEPTPWPAEDVVALYFGRACLENRFAQENRELGLNRVFSYHVPGQMVATAAGMYVWNRRTCLGAQLLEIQPDPVQPIQTPTATDPIPDVPEPPTSASSRPSASSPPSTPPLSPDTSLSAVLATDWSQALVGRPGWSQTKAGLQCPAAKPLRVRASKTTVNSAGKLNIVLRAAKSDCRNCPKRSECTTSQLPTYRKEISMVVGQPRPTKPEAPPRQPVWQPPPPVIRGPTAVSLPRLVPSVLRRAWLDAAQAAELRVFVTEPPRPPRSPDYLARTPAERQHRRHTWQQRGERHRLPPKVEVDLDLRRAHGLRNALVSTGFVVIGD